MTRGDVQAAPLELLAESPQKRDKDAPTSGRIPDYVGERIRRLPSDGCNVVEGSTPVVWFGHLATSRIATVGLNPSSREFQEDRLETQASLTRDGISRADSEWVARVVAACDRYFEHRPYDSWFKVLDESVVKAFEGSYYSGDACHLDLVQWATSHRWGNLTPGAKKKLLGEDAPFLAHLIGEPNLRVVMLNGWGVVTNFRRFVAPLAEVAPPITTCGISTRFYASKIGELTVIGWSKNLTDSWEIQNSPPEVAEAFRQAVAQRSRELCPV